MTKQLIGVQELAKYLDLSIPFVRKMIISRRIPYFKIGGRIKFDLVEINKWIDEQKLEERRSILFI